MEPMGLGEEGLRGCRQKFSCLYPEYFNLDFQAFEVVFVLLVLL